MSNPTVDIPALKPRNRLRKLPKRRPGSLVSCRAPSPRPTLAVTGKDPTQKVTTIITSQQDLKSDSHPRSHGLPLVTDLSDAKWEEFVRKSGYVLPMTKSPQLEQIKTTVSPSSSPPPVTVMYEQQSQLVPEFAHLAVASGLQLQPPNRNPQRQSSLEGSTRVPSLRSPSSSSTSTTTTVSSVSTSSSSSSKIRRYSKTPVLSIGQLEGQLMLEKVRSADDEPSRKPKTPVPPVPKRSARRSSAAEQMAEQYRSLLQSRSCAKLRPDNDDDEDETEAHEDDSHTRQDSIETIRSAIARRPPVQERRQRVPVVVSPPSPISSPRYDAEEASECSPTSSNGTLVGFEENAVYDDAIYFKPAFTPTDGGSILTPIPEDEYYVSNYNTPLGSPQEETADDAVSLQICVDLLGKELKAAMERQNERADDDDGSRPTSPLQIWLMIEAYERLRDQISGAKEGSTAHNLSRSEARSLEAMFDTWLKALYQVHDGITRQSGHS